MIGKMKLFKEWGLEESVTRIEKDRFRYMYDLGVIDFVFLENENQFFEAHAKIWCENRTEFFLAIFENGEIYVCDSKTKPDKKCPLGKPVIDSFKYGENTRKAHKYAYLFKREHIESGECMKEVQGSLSKKMRITIDEDLMSNMELCKKKITKLLNKEGKKEIAEKIIDRCLFIRFLEEKSGRNNLKRILSNGDGAGLLDLFDFYSDIFKDIFQKGDILHSIDSGVVRELACIFGDAYSGPFTGYLFGYIPVEVITCMYKKMLSQERENSFTPGPITDFIADNILDERYIADKIRKGTKIKILDPLCGPGEFLVTFLEKVIEKKGTNGAGLNLEEKIQILEDCLYGIGMSRRALRAAALTLYLKVIEDEKPDVIQNVFFSEDRHFTSKLHLVLDKPFNNPFHQKFDVIVCNLLRGKGPQHILHMKEWMEKRALCSVIAPLSYFTTSKFKKFRKDFIKKYALKSFINLSNMDITGGNPVCIAFFTDTYGEYTDYTLVKFYTPEYTYFSRITGFIGKDKRARVAIKALKENDALWQVYALGFHKYRRLTKSLDTKACSHLGDFLERDKTPGICRENAHPPKEDRICAEEISKTYNASSKVTDYVDSIPSGRQEQAPESGYVERAKDILEEKKLIIMRTWPIRAFIDAGIHDHSWSCTVKAGCPEEYLPLFESILNSKLAAFYLEVKYRLGVEGCPDIDEKHIDRFPLPDLEDDHGIINKIVETASVLKSLPVSSPQYRKIQDDLENLIFTLYGLNYYDLKEVEQYTIEKEKGALVTEKDIKKYCEEFIDTLHSFVKEGYFLRPEWATSACFGTMVLFSLSRTVIPLQYNKDLEQFVHIIKDQEAEHEKKDIFKEKKIRFYDDKGLYIYRSNKLIDWTEFMAIKDSNEELNLYFQNLEDE